MLKKSLSLSVIVCFFLTTLTPYPQAHADTVLNLPAPGAMVNLSPAYESVIIKGLTVHQDNPFLFDFIVEPGDSKIQGEQLKAESTKLVKYFLAALTVPEKELWVNLSPYEKDRIVPQTLGVTEMGRDMLAQDYILKQLTASLIYPEKQLGKDFWGRAYQLAEGKYGTTNIPINTFNKVWIIPKSATVYEHNGSAFVVDSHLTVMLEEDYLALEKNQRQPGDMFKSELQRTCPQAGCQASKPLNVKAPQGNNGSTSKSINAIGSQAVREVIIPEIEKEVNTGKNFANLRQIYNSMILAIWYKQNLKQTLLNQVYSNQGKTNGIDLQDKTAKEEIYNQYLRAFKKGVYNYIKEDLDPATRQMTAKKYFSGGAVAPTKVTNITAYPALTGREKAELPGPTDFAMDVEVNFVKGDYAMVISPEIRKAFGNDEAAARATIEERAVAIQQADPNTKEHGATIKERLAAIQEANPSFTQQQVMEQLAMEQLAWEYKPRPIENVFPGDNWKFMLAAARAGEKAPILLLDLEDAVSTTRKDIARKVIVLLIRAFRGQGLSQDEFNYLRENTLPKETKIPEDLFKLEDGEYKLDPKDQFHKNQMILFRPNNLRTKWSAADYAYVLREAGDLIDGLYMPKVEGPEDVRIGVSIARAIQKQKGWRIGRHKFFILTEIPGAVLTAEDILKVAPEVEEVNLGVVDYTAATGGNFQVQIDQFPFMRFPLLRLGEAAENTGKAAGTGITNQFTAEATAEDTQKLIKLGRIHRKWSVHPAHLKGMEPFIAKFPPIVRKHIKYDPLPDFDLKQLDQWAQESRPIIPPQVLLPREVELTRAAVTVDIENAGDIRQALESKADMIILDTKGNPRPMVTAETIDQLNGNVGQNKKNILVELDANASPEDISGRINYIVSRLHMNFQGFVLHNVMDATQVRRLDGALSEAENDYGLKIGSLKIGVSFNSPNAVEEQSRVLNDTSKGVLYASNRLQWAFLDLPALPKEEEDDPVTRGYNYYHSMFIAMTAHAQVDSIDGYSKDEDVARETSVSSIWGFQGKLARLNQIDQIINAMNPQRVGEAPPKLDTPQAMSEWRKSDEGKQYVRKYGIIWKNSLERSLDIISLYAVADQDRNLGAVLYTDPLTGSGEIVDAASARIPFRLLEKALKAGQLSDPEKATYLQARERLLLAMRLGGLDASAEKVFPGQRILADTVIMRKWMVNAFAKNGDTNQYHLTLEYAEASKFKGLVAHGLLTVTTALAGVKAKLPAYNIQSIISVNFSAPVYFDNTITPVINVSSVAQDGSVKINVSIVNQDGKTVAKLSAVMVPSSTETLLEPISDEFLKTLEPTKATIPAQIFDFTNPQSPREQTFEQKGDITTENLRIVQSLSHVTSPTLLSQLTAIKLMALMSAKAVPGHLLGGANNIQFFAPIKEGDDLTATATVPPADKIRLTKKDKTPIVDVHIEIKNKDGELVLTADLVKLMEVRDPAMSIEKLLDVQNPETTGPGGINFDPALLSLQIKRDGQGIPLPIAQQPVAIIKIDGLKPEVIKMTPANMPQLLGFEKAP